MKAFLKITIFTCISMSLGGCTFQGNNFYTGPSDPCGFSIDPRSNGPVKWDEDAFPIPFYIHESVPEEAQENFISAIAQWNGSWKNYLTQQGLEYKPLFSIVGNGSLFSGEIENDSYNMVFFTHDFSEFGTKSTQAITKIYSINRKIKDTDIVVNNQHFDYFFDSSYDDSVLALKKKQTAERMLASLKVPTFWEDIKIKLNSAIQFLLNFFVKQDHARRLANIRRARVPRGQIDFPSLMIHELGHVPGLAHADHEHSKSSVMAPKLPYGISRRYISSYDLNNLTCGYRASE